MSQKYVIVTDSTTDLPHSFVEENNIYVIPMRFQIANKEYLNYLDGRELDTKSFYDLMRKGEMGKTTQLTISDIEGTYRKVLEDGNDILGISFSSGLSGSYNTLRVVVEGLKEEYPERRIEIIDSKAASLGEGLIVYYANEYLKEGLSLDENLKKLNELIPHLAMWFTVDDIDTLRRGGRVSNVQAFLAKTIKIKPVLHVDDDGRLSPVYKSVGRKKALKTIVEELNKTIDRSYVQTLMLGHGDCLEDALYVAEKIKEVVEVKDIIINPIGPVIGSHSGPGTIALFFVASKR